TFDFSTGQWVTDPPSTRRVAFHSDGPVYEVSDIWVSLPAGPTHTSGLAILTLDEPVPESVVENVARVYLGDVNDLLGASALVAGFGDLCQDCGLEGIRRVGA